MSNKTTEPTQKTETPKQIQLSPTKQSIIIGLYQQKQQLERQIATLNEAFTEVITPLLAPGSFASQYQLATDEKTGVIFLELKPESTEKPEKNVVGFPEQT